MPKFGVSFVLVGALAILYISTGEFLDVDDPQLLSIREHILKAYYLRPDPVNQCTEQRHLAAIKLYTRVVAEKEQDDILLDLQRSIVNNEDNYFAGLPEAITAIASSRIKFIVYWERLLINSATYRNPLSGRTVTLHSFYSPATYISLNYTEPSTGCFMELVNCYPFPKWLSKYYRNYVPRITRLQLSGANSTKTSRNIFVRTSDGIGGKFTEMIRFASDKWLDQVYRDSSIRRSILLGGIPEQVNKTSTNSSMDDDADFVTYPYRATSAEANKDD